MATDTETATTFLYNRRTVYSILNFDCGDLYELKLMKEKMLQSHPHNNRNVQRIYRPVDIQSPVLIFKLI